MPPWLSARMAALGRVLVEALVLHYGRDEVLRRLAHPFWFQSLGCVMGMDWHSSGITTSVLGALKRGLGPVERELGLHVCGGRGKQSRKTPDELRALGDAHRLRRRRAGAHLEAGGEGRLGRACRTAISSTCTASSSPTTASGWSCSRACGPRRRRRAAITGSSEGVRTSSTSRTPRSLRSGASRHGDDREPDRSPRRGIARGAARARRARAGRGRGAAAASGDAAPSRRARQRRARAPAARPRSRPPPSGRRPTSPSCC